DGAEHRLPGGAKVIDLTGAFERPYNWAGYFTGPDAVQRALAVDAIRQAGAPVQLTWGSFSRTVVVKDFTCSHERGGFWCPYRISCVDVPVQQSGTTGPTLLGSLTSDLGDALGIPDLVNTADSVLSGAGQALSV